MELGHYCSAAIVSAFNKGGATVTMKVVQALVKSCCYVIGSLQCHRITSKMRMKSFSSRGSLAVNCVLISVLGGTAALLGPAAAASGNVAPGKFCWKR